MRTDDLCKLLDTTEESLVKILEERYLSNRIYTNAGIVLISINPYTNLDLYNKNIMNAYFNTSNVDPHIFGICESAFQDIKQKNQTIMISGESGSGKTENTKLLQDYLIVRTETNKILKEKIDALTVILESFGNAKTILNDNSSRVGKMVSYYIDESITGIKLKTFLLEKSRVTHQNEGECNFNIFYQLCKDKNLKIENDYINTNVKIKENYKTIKRAMINLGFENIEFIENILLVILYFGFMKFDSKDKQIYIKEMKYTKFICNILKTDYDFLEKILLKKEIRVNEEVLTKYNTVEEAYTIRDSISRILYVKIFDLIVQKINSTLYTTSGPCINILDIFGFEVFKENSLDQLCINYANEKIQDDFIKKIFEIKQEEYKEEIEDYKYVSFLSNTILINEFEKRCGIFDLIDEESKNKFGSFDNLRNKIVSYIKNGVKIKSNDKIIVKHFIKDVEYNIKDFISKNKEVKIDNSLFFNLFSGNVNNTTVLSSFLNSLKDLFLEINNTQIKYIRCIKPNNTKSNMFDKNVVFDQLISTGILEVIKISKQIYTYEMNKEEWYQKYCKYKKVLEGKTKVYFNSDVKIAIEIVEKMKDDRKRRVMNWFMKKLMEKKEGLNNPTFSSEKNEPENYENELKNWLDMKTNQDSNKNICEKKEDTDLLPNVDICEKDDKKEFIKFKDQTFDTAEIIMNSIFKDENENIVQTEEFNEKLETKQENLEKNLKNIKPEEDTKKETEVIQSDTTNQDIVTKEEFFEIKENELKDAANLEKAILPDENIKEDVEIIKEENKAKEETKDKEDENKYEDLIEKDEETEKIIELKENENTYEDFIEKETDEFSKLFENEELNKDFDFEDSFSNTENISENLTITNKDGTLLIDKNIPTYEDVASPDSFSSPNREIISHCSNCANLELKYKFVQEALKEANLRLSSSSPQMESASTLFSRLFNIYLENIPIACSIPRSEMLSFAHSAFLITKKTNKNTKESALIFVEEISLRLKYFDKNINHLLFFLSNLIEYSKLVGNISDLQELIRKLFINLSDFYLDLIKDLISSVVDYQELSNFKCGDSFIKKFFKPVSIHKLVKSLYFINKQMKFYHLDKTYKNNIIKYLLSNINTSVFNNIIIKNNFLSFNRCIQINYNLNQIRKFLQDIEYSEESESFKHLFEIIKLVNMTYSSEFSSETIRNNCEILTKAQITTFLVKMGYEEEKERIKDHVFISSEALQFVEEIDKIEENFVIPRFIPSEELKFVLQ